MLTIRSTTNIHGVRAAQVCDFLLHCDDERYQRWWPGTHLRFHTVKGRPGEVGSVVYMDERIGRRRVRGKAVLVELVAPTRLVYRGWGGLPVTLILELSDEPTGVRLEHTIRLGYEGLGAALDPLIRVFGRGFDEDMDEHVRVEFARLGEQLAAA